MPQHDEQDALDSN